MKDKEETEPSGQNIDVIEKIKAYYPRMSKSQKKVASFVLNHKDMVPALSVTKMAKAVAVSEATLVRFAMFLDYEGFPEFKRALSEDLKARLTTVDRLNMEADNVAMFSDEKVLQFMSLSIRRDIVSVRDTLKQMDRRTICQAVKAIIEAPRIYIIGFRTTGLLVEMMSYYLGFVVEDVRVVNQHALDVYEQLVKINAEDLVIGLSFPRYAKKTYDLLKFVKKFSPTVLAITDSESAPINEFADIRLYAKTSCASFVDSLAAPLSMINALTAAVGFSNLNQTKDTFNRLEEVWKNQYIYKGEE